MTYIRTKHGFFCGRLTLPLGVTLIFFSEIFLCGGIHVVAQSDESSTDVASDSPSVSVAKNVGELQWPRFLGANYDGAALVGDQSIDWSVEPSFQWNIEVGDGYGIASVNGGRVYQSDAVGGSRFTAGDERLRCLDLSSGKVLWEKQEPIEYQDMYGYEAGPRSSPIIHQGRVITYGVTGLLMCRDALTGSTLWKNEVSQTYGVVQNFFGVGAAPMVAGDLVVVMVGGSPPEDQDLPPGQLDRVNPNGTALVAFDLNNGKEKWKVGDDLASYSSPRFMKIGGKDSVIAFCRGGLLAVELETGKQLWKYAHRASILESVNAMMPIVNNDQIFISECYQLGSVLLQV
ncbi:MAG: PQQ-binding-like beta-propeller repeat protein, partial [Planctomycetota bacterium]|nr:PQQ-binding-like beta-propeller repeat protein [Planctomycetota bacterium]